MDKKSFIALSPGDGQTLTKGHLEKWLFLWGFRCYITFFNIPQ